MQFARKTIFGGLTMILAFGLAVAGDTRMKYPETKKTDHVDEYHGTKVPDPYRWLEDDVRQSKEVAAWVEAQNKVTTAFLESIPQRDAIKKRLSGGAEHYCAPALLDEKVDGVIEKMNAVDRK